MFEIILGDRGGLFFRDLSNCRSDSYMMSRGVAAGYFTGCDIIRGQVALRGNGPALYDIAIQVGASGHWIDSNGSVRRGNRHVLACHIEDFTELDSDQLVGAVLDFMEAKGMSLDVQLSESRLRWHVRQLVARMA